MVVACQRDRFEDLHRVEMLRKRRPGHLGDGPAVDEIVDQGDQGLLRRRPAGASRPSVTVAATCSDVKPALSAKKAT